MPKVPHLKIITCQNTHKTKQKSTPQNWGQKTVNHIVARKQTIDPVFGRLEVVASPIRLLLHGQRLNPISKQQKAEASDQKNRYLQCDLQLQVSHQWHFNFLVRSCFPNLFPGDNQKCRGHARYHAGRTLSYLRRLVASSGPWLPQSAGVIMPQ
ncbi:hypothetical protein V6N13_045713 [Hibiscus sabdariffa]